MAVGRHQPGVPGLDGRDEDDAGPAPAGGQDQAHPGVRGRALQAQDQGQERY